MNEQVLSNLSMVTSVVVYLLAMFAHAAEWASARRLDPAAETVEGSVTETASQRVAERELVAAGAGGGSVVEAPAAETLDSHPDGTGGADAPAEAGAVRQRVESFGRIGFALTVIGFALSVLGVVLRGVAAGRAPWGNMYEFTTAAMVFIVAVYLVLAGRFRMRWLGLPVTLLAAIGNGLAVTVFYVAVAPLVPALHSVWFLIHIVAAAISGAAFNVGGVASILYLIKRRAENKGAVRGYLTRLPEARKIDVIAYRFNAFAFPLWTFTVAAGSIWAEYAWGRYWGWDPKETWALVTWVIYACYLHARATAGWRGRNAAIIGIIGMASFWFNFIGVNLLFAGLHSYAGV
ncbi:cytochrome c-type biogenesis protein CcsB [Friedmanniella endophytica]|uniref:Cytochrome c-type biogenesis protein CcsB n=1 Tax=Microlunatus kandeliicorticis TaxID=1759536 RepID=A0A7W3IVT4_9ACTN|nr:c-type cytochrome biogenesis protein CcsB [Microlunatus kandeliicorticis]MBA8796188.1 cytochrome c-type biogenesis protein CcsB [Microlunatus kandeliicorticis]